MEQTALNSPKQMNETPFLPKTWNCLKVGNMAKFISKNGRISSGLVRYVGPMASESTTSTQDDEIFIGLRVYGDKGDCDGTFEGRKFFDW